jgi:predicted permease
MFPNLRFSLRILRKHAKLTIIAVLSLAIGMAAASVGLSTFNALLVQPPAVPEPNRLLTIYTVTPDLPFNQLSYPDYLYYRDNNQVFSGVCAVPFSITMSPIIFEHREKNGLINAVSDNYFSVLGIQPFLGRWFPSGEDDHPSTSVVISYPYWKSLGADSHIVGKPITANGADLTIIGVTPRGFAGTILTDLPDIWYPLSRQPSSTDWRSDRESRNFSLIGRVKPGVTSTQALANMQMLSTQLATAYPETNKQRVAAVTKTSMLPPDSVGDAKFLGTLILAIVALVLFAACANVANLLLALASVRRHEILIRAALGATRAHLIRQLLLDSTIISVSGGLLGFALATYGLHRLLDFKPYLPGLGVFNLTVDFRPDFAVLVAMFVVVLAVGLATGLAPGLQASTPNLAAAMSGEIAIGGTRKGRVRSLLVVMQVAACTIVLIGVGLCLKSLLNLRKENFGFSARNVAIYTFNNLQDSGYSEQRGREFYTRVREAVTQLPGVESISLADMYPLGMGGNSGAEHVHIDGGIADSEHGDLIGFGNVDAAYFPTLGIPILDGRVFRESDTAKSPEVVVINQTMARKYWPNQDPVGKSVRREPDKRFATVVGVVGDTKVTDVDEEVRPLMYFALSQHYQPRFSALVRTKGNSAQWMNPLAEIARKLDPELGYQSLTMNENLGFAFYIPRVVLICVSGFGALAFFLAAIGLYGAVFYSVSERTREMGIRVALGAQQWDLWKLIFRQTSTITAIGVVLGIAGGIGASILARSLLYQIQSVEWFVLFGVAFVMLAMTIVTAYSAARPWMRVDPMKSVRHV